MAVTSKDLQKTEYRYGFHDPDNYIFKSQRGLSPQIVEEISRYKNEPEWMRKFRLRALQIFQRKPLPMWGANLTEIDFDNIFYYVKPSEKTEKSWEEVPSYIKETFDKLGIPESERKFLAGVSAQYESEVVYHNIREDLEKQGVLFSDMDTGLREHPDIVREYFGTVIPPGDNKFAALNSAVWSGGSFIYVPKGAHIRYTTIQNWSSNVYNLVTKRAVAHEDALVEWVDGNLGSKVTMKYPGVYLMGPRAKAEIISVAFAGDGQHQDAGGKVIHAAPDTTSTITSKSISKDGGRAAYRGLLRVGKGAEHSKAFVRCDALLLDEKSRSDTYPSIEIDEERVDIGHEATVSKVSDEQLFYLQSRGLSETEAKTMIVNGFFEAFTKELPMEYAVELNRLRALEAFERLPMPDQRTEGWRRTSLRGLNLDALDPVLQVDGRPATSD